MLQKRHRIVLVLAWLGGAALLACSATDYPPAAGGGGASSTSSSGGSGAGASSGSSSSGDAGSEQDSGASACTGIPREGSPLTLMDVAQATPTPSGGPIIAGTYVLTEFTNYTGIGGANGLTEEVLKSTMLVTSTILRIAETDETGDLPPQAFTYTTSDATLTMTSICPLAGAPRTRQYTAEGNTLSIFQGAIVRVFTRQ